MKKNRLFIVLIIALALSCQRISDPREYIEGDLIAKGVKVNDKFEGEVRYFDKNGILITISNFVNGVLNGRSQIFYSNGKKHQDQFFVNGKMHGFLSVFDTSGNLKFKQFYFYNNPCGPEMNYVNGKISSYTFNNFEHDLLFSSQYNSKGELFVYKVSKERVFYSVIAKGDSVKKYWVYLFTPNPPEMAFSYKYVIKNKYDSIIHNEIIDISNFVSEFGIQPNDTAIRQYIDVEYFDSEEKKRKQWILSDIFNQ